MPGEPLRGYVLAGGLSSRMGENKATLRMGERTFLEVALDALRAITTEVAVVGPAVGEMRGIRYVADRFPGCGPMGGMEAALGDCVERGGAWAVFVPVDMPLLPGGLFRELVELWTGSEGARMGAAVVGGRMQPLLCALHVELQPMVRSSLERGDYKVQPMLRAAGMELARSSGDSAEKALLLTDVSFGEGEVLAAGRPLAWKPTRAEWERRASWFLNANTPEEMLQVRAVLEKEGSKLGV